MSLKVVVVDDQALVRRGFAMMLDHQPDIEVVAEAATGVEAIAVVREQKPDVVLMDIRMPEMDGLEATRIILTDHADDTRIIVLTTFDPDEYIYGALRAGASGFLLKDTPPEELIAAVRAVAAGGALLAPDVTQRLISQFAAHSGANTKMRARIDRLTERERDVLECIASGSSNQEISDALDIGSATVKTHVSSVLSKLGLRDRAQAVIFAYESGFVTAGNADVGH
ncbi:response regulator transcription factor [Congregibacter variabilis]|uniref:Response regulator transcription factor n=1 Tax=Congregibacter variabilis TaxID=3081200 RepID=A0ABZ0I265_9GAMM|nr:response regulator transcription factor [Congregibacter sp. IMCC43200]